jgi:hypothetical protein
MTFSFTGKDCHVGVLEAGVLVISSCDCGCASIGFAHSEKARWATGTSVFPVSAVVRNAAGVEIGGMVLFPKGGELHDVDVLSFDDDYTFPTVKCVTWESSKAT